MMTPREADEVLTAAKRLYTQEDIERVLDKMASAISQKLSRENPIILCVLNGALIPMGHLLTRLAFPLRHDYIHASRYRGEISGNDLEWLGKPSISLENETVLVMDDILDEGITLAEIVNACRDAGAREVYTAVLVEKRHDRGNGFIPDFVGLQVDDHYVFGFGMDYKGYWRNAAGIFAAKGTD